MRRRVTEAPVGHLATVSIDGRPHLVPCCFVLEGDTVLFNPYGVMLVNPAKHPHVKKDLGQEFIDWVTGPKGQAAVAAYKIGGEQLFFPNANSPR